MGNNPSHPHPSRSHPASGSTPTTPVDPFHLPHSAVTPQSTPHSPLPPPGPPLPPLRSTFVDGGYLLPLSNIYPASQQDWLHHHTQRLILSRKLAPFYRGLEDWDPTWNPQRISQALESAVLARRTLVQDIERKELHEKLEQDKLTFAGTTSRRLGRTLEGQINSHQSYPESNPLLRKEVFDAVLTFDLRPEETDRYLNETAECPICFL